MEWTSIAALIAALAFAILVLFLCWTLIGFNKIMKEVKQTVVEVNDSIKIITKDVDQLSIEVEGLLNKSNSLIDDLNGKLAQTDPLFKAVGDLGTSVSGVQASTRKVTQSFKAGHFLKRVTPFGGRKQEAAAKTPAAADVKPTTPTADKPKPKPKATGSQLDYLIQKKPSHTAGEITLKK